MNVKIRILDSDQIFVLFFVFSEHKYVWRERKLKVNTDKIQIKIQTVKNVCVEIELFE